MLRIPFAQGWLNPLFKGLVRQLEDALMQIVKRGHQIAGNISQLTAPSSRSTDLCFNQSGTQGFFRGLDSRPDEPIAATDVRRGGLDRAR